MASKHKMLALYDDFEECFKAIKAIRGGAVKGVTVDDLTVLSPVDHHGIDEALGPRPVNVQRFTLLGALFGVTFGFFFLASAQASFLVQPQGGKPVVPLPTNFVLMYEMLIFFAVWTTVLVFPVLSGLFKKRDSLYSEKLTVDHMGVIVEEVDGHNLDAMKDFFKNNKAVEIREEKI
ncbi:MAG: DUF3341 domain-containing protein [Gammaproteobacteria bacterium]|nr:DUF3341 domain-containing protein [Gammaproteobacteria bacterium]MDH5691940.1 DUF3341 domain-containing protein [Gammaproteobacteria bacterium]